MSEVYVFDTDAEDLTTFGLVGALEPISCTFTEVANGLSELSLVHPLDEWEKYKALETGRLLVCDVPVRMTPEIEGGSIVTSVEKAVVKNGATKAQRTLYTKRSGGKKKKVVPRGTSVTLVQRNDDWNRWKIKAGKYGTNWIAADALEVGETIEIGDNSQSIESVEPAWTVAPQIFRIDEVNKQIDRVEVTASHYSYDLLGNLTFYKNNGTVSIGDVLDGVLGQTAVSHDFSAYTNLSDTRTGFDYTGKSPIAAFLDPDAGVTARFGCGLVRDNNELYFLKDPGLNRGVVIEYRKNLTGVDATFSEDEVVTQIIPVGRTKSGAPLYLDVATYGGKADTAVVSIGGTNYVVVRSTAHLNDYAIPHLQYMEVEDAQVGTGVSTADARRKMYEAAQAAFADGCDEGSVAMRVSFVNLGDTAEYAAYKGLEDLFLWDYATIRHGPQSIAVTARVVSITWNVLAGRMESMELGDVLPTLGGERLSAWQIPPVDGGKIFYGTITQLQIADGIIYQEKLADGAVTATKLDTEVADDIAAGAAAGETAQAAQETAEQAQEAATEAQQAAYQAQEGIDAVIEQAAEGIYISDRSQTATTRALVAPDGFRVLDPDGTVSASLGPRVQTLGTLIIRQTSDGGHAFYNTLQEG